MTGKTDETPRRIGPHDMALPELLALIRESFADMDRRIDPPSSMLRMTTDNLSRAAAEGEIWAIGTPVLACVILSETPGALYLGKLAVDRAARGRGYARVLIARAVQSARERGLPALELQTRVELTENHETFARLGFVETGRTAHPGYDRPTSITMRRPVTG
ncbi:GNAT family N-acetyltransferase [Marinibacterium profundimaris]|uniref:N-acetyltransferase domain-containing protein n=1 Tax=Marinibacterium profundimaris TaxID=1679460 RepID=A0A225NSS4_9RHOB|nr:GNAT family N-acetyltransferase [Marinibacterium profundimaris]OWU74670.1 hypothetical protein ATO3_08565 [Marinibacterium profundimaris]